jgi:hypothetical protein
MLCEHWDGFRSCARGRAALYLQGPRCDEHAPWAVAGRDDPRPHATPEPLPGAQTWSFRKSDTALFDERARKSGKRASGKQREASHRA